MSALSDDDLDLASQTEAELDRAWHLWFSLAQATNDDDPPFTHGVLVSLSAEDLAREGTGPCPSGQARVGRTGGS